jgi:hypothetical protein
VVYVIASHSIHYSIQKEHTDKVSQCFSAKTKRFQYSRSVVNSIDAIKQHLLAISRDLLTFVPRNCTPVFTPNIRLSAFDKPFCGVDDTKDNANKLYSRSFSPLITLIW